MWVDCWLLSTAMNPLKKAASLLKGKSVKQVQIDSDSDSDVDSKSSTPMKGNASVASTKRSMFSMRSPGTGKSVQSPETRSNQSNLDTQLQQLQAASRGSKPITSPQPPQSIDPRNNLASPKTPSDRSISQSSVASQSIHSSAAPPPAPRSTPSAVAPPVSVAPPAAAASPPPPSFSEEIKTLQHKITLLEQENLHLKSDKRALEHSLTESQNLIFEQKQTLQKNQEVLSSQEKKIKELIHEEEEMRKELYSKYDEISSLEASRERLNGQYLEVAKQLRVIESEAMNKKYEMMTSPAPSPYPPPPPPPVIITDPASSSSVSSSRRRDEELGDLHHQMKEFEEKLKTQRSLVESKQLMNMKLDARNRELIQQLDQLKSHLSHSQHEGNEKKEMIRRLQEELNEYQERYEGPENIDKKKISELCHEIEILRTTVTVSKQTQESLEEKHRVHLISLDDEMEFLRKLIREYEQEIEVYEGKLEEESSEMTQLLVRMKGRNEGLYRFLQAIFRRYQEQERQADATNLPIEETEIGAPGGDSEGMTMTRRGESYSSEEKERERGSEENDTKATSTPPPPQPVLDLQDLIFLLDSHIFTLKVKAGHRPLHQILSQLTNRSALPSSVSVPASSFASGSAVSPRSPHLLSFSSTLIDRSASSSSPTKPSRPPPVSAGGRVSQECTLHLLDFMDKYQLAELTKHFQTLKPSPEEPSTPPALPHSSPSPGLGQQGYEGARSPMKLGSSRGTSSRRPPTMTTPYGGESENGSVGLFSAPTLTPPFPHPPLSLHYSESIHDLH
jgi:hypothetical protein